jgi:hypothetical protein
MGPIELSVVRWITKVWLYLLQKFRKTEQVNNPARLQSSWCEGTNDSIVSAARLHDHSVLFIISSFGATVVRLHLKWDKLRMVGHGCRYGHGFIGGKCLDPRVPKGILVPCDGRCGLDPNLSSLAYLLVAWTRQKRSHEQKGFRLVAASLA